MRPSRWFAVLACAVLAAPLRGGGEPPAARDEYVYVENTKLWVSLIHGGYQIFGKLDHTGWFTPDRTMPPRKWPTGAGGSEPPDRLMNGDSGTAYEYRSGRLILGEIDQDGNFVPDLGSKVIAFKDYKPGGNAPPIYNLPGKFVK